MLHSLQYPNHSYFYRTAGEQKLRCGTHTHSSCNFVEGLTPLFGIWLYNTRLEGQQRTKYAFKFNVTAPPCPWWHYQVSVGPLKSETLVDQGKINSAARAEFFPRTHTCGRTDVSQTLPPERRRGRRGCVRSGVRCSANAGEPRPGRCFIAERAREFANALT